jgi:hypothetical protein
VALLCGEVIESIRDHTSVVLKKGIGVLLQVFYPLPPLLEGGQFPAGSAAATNPQAPISLAGDA